MEVIMNNHLNPGTNILTSGMELVSEHIEYLFQMIAHKHAKNLVNQIAFNEDLPQNQFGSFHGPSRSICVNITAHLAHNLEKIQTTNPNMSIRALLIMELINTALHETRHASYKEESDDFSDAETDAEEKLCQDFANENMWDVGKDFDLEVQSFGKLIDDELTALFRTFRESKNSDLFHTWQMNQLNMMEKGILYLDEKNEIIIKNMFELCSYFSKQNNWDEATIIPFEADAPEITEQSLGLTDEDDCPFDVDEPTAAHSEPAPVAAAPVEEGPTVCQYEGYDPLDDHGVTEIISGDLPDMVASPDNLPAYTSPVATAEVYHAEDVLVAGHEQVQVVTPQGIEVQSVPSNQVGQVHSDNIRAIAEIVLRRLFHHIYSKCGWDGKGKFSNPGAVLEAVGIDDIPGATSLFKKMDTTDNMGVYKSQADVGAFITGLVSKQGLPMYRIFLNNNGTLVRRTFIPQNPEKTSKWGGMARDGWRIVMLLGESMPPKLDIKTEPGQQLGQETFNIWTK